MNFKNLTHFCCLFTILFFVQCEKAPTLQPTSDRIPFNQIPVLEKEVIWTAAIDNDREDDLGYFNLTHTFNFGGFLPLPDVVCVTETSIETVNYDEANSNLSITIDAVFEQATDEMPAFSETISLHLNELSEGSHTITPNTNTCYISTNNELGFETEGLFTLGNVTILAITDTYVAGSYSIGNTGGGCVIDESMMFGRIDGDFQLFF